VTLDEHTRDAALAQLHRQRHTDGPATHDGYVIALHAALPL
jgi:hypothetical protein